MRRYQIISCDGHLETPPDPWLRHLPPAYRDVAPRLVRLPEGGEAWIVEGFPPIHNGQNLSAGRPVKVRGASYWNEDGSPGPGTGDGAQRLCEQDADGIDAEVLYPPIFISKLIEAIPDRAAYLAMVRAYNDFLAEYCAIAPDRLIGVAAVPVTGIDDAVAEIGRCQRLGLRAVRLSMFPNGGGGPQPADDRFWEASITLGLKLAAHVTFGGRDKMNPLLLATATANFDLVTAMVSRATIGAPALLISTMVASGVFDRFPALEIYLAETNAGWIPEAFYMLDDSYRLFRDWYGADLRLRPSEYAARHFWFGMVRDPVALRMRDLLPADRLMWGSDFPHSVTSYPHSREFLRSAFEGVPDALRRRILVDNPCRFFGLDPTRDITSTPG